MSIKNMFSEKRISFDVKAESKEAVLDELIELLDDDDKLLDKEEFKKAVLKREEEFSTGIGMGIAIPHGKSNAVKEAAMVFGKSVKGVDYDSMDGKPAHMIFLIAVPENSNDTHLKALSEISRKLMHKDVRDSIMASEKFADFIKVFDN
ncbi:PTS sugar transporter subunit IIA [Clostridium sediminicola]|uniref:PTS sugar transporter subunit IIA n=1 Tax=Clostridium sediminicola TaxID=3114879 RepID=UPI0031F25376